MPKRIILAVFIFLFFATCVGGAFWFGFRAGEANVPEIVKVEGLSNKTEGKSEAVDFSTFWEAWNIVNEKFVMTNGTATTSKKITNQDKVWGAVEGMVAALDDPYTIFLRPEKNKIFEEDISGNFGGVGMEVGMKNGALAVVAPLADSPAQKAGIKAGDFILKIDGGITAGMGADEAVALIRGNKGTSVKLTLQRGETGKPFEISIVRDTIVIPTLEEKKLPSGVYLIRLFNFSAPSPDLFRKALQNFSQSGTDKLIVDLRGNPGGYLEAAIDMASWFLPSGKLVVAEKHGGKGEDKEYRSKGYDVFNKNLKMVILVDKGSASASEILAGALSEYGVATLIGEKTFGKGSVQELVPLDDGSSIKITIAKWYTPNGRSISQNGLDPQIAVPMTDKDIKDDKDPQLDRAVEYLLRK